MIIRNLYKVLICLAGIILFFNLGISQSQKVNSNSNKKFSINLKSKAIVIGPIIKLGDIGYVVTSDSLKRTQLAAIKIGIAPPPGESSEITLNHIKRCIKKAGFEELTSFIKGPHVVRVTTAQIEIDKAFLMEEYASNYKNHNINYEINS